MVPRQDPYRQLCSLSKKSTVAFRVLLSDTSVESLAHIISGRQPITQWMLGISSTNERWAEKWCDVGPRWKVDIIKHHNGLLWDRILRPNLTLLTNPFLVSFFHRHALTFLNEASRGCTKQRSVYLCGPLVKRAWRRISPVVPVRLRYDCERGRSFTFSLSDDLSHHLYF